MLFFVLGSDYSYLYIQGIYLFFQGLLQSRLIGLRNPNAGCCLNPKRKIPGLGGASRLARASETPP